MSVGQRERDTSLFGAPENVLDLIRAVEGAHSGVPSTELPTGHYMSVNGGPDAGFERAVREGNEHALLALVVTPSQRVFSVNRVVVSGEDGGHWTGLTVNDLNHEYPDGGTEARTKGFLDVRGGFQPVALDDGVELQYAPGDAEGQDGFTIANTSGKSLRVAYGSGNHPNNGGGYFGACWADTRTGERSLAALHKGGFLPGQENAEVTAKLQAGHVETRETGRVVLQGEVVTDTLFMHPDGRWAHRSMDCPEDVKAWADEHTAYAAEATERMVCQLDEWSIRERGEGAGWLFEMLERGEEWREDLTRTAPGEPLGAHQKMGVVDSFDPSRENGGMFMNDAMSWRPRGRHAAQTS